jgi:hypothetical protein
MTSVLRILLLTAPFMLVIAFLLLARWARRRNHELMRSGRPLRFTNYWIYLKNGNFRQSAQHYFFGSMPTFVTKVGLGLLILAGLAFMACLVFLLFALLRSQGWL